MNYDCLQPSDSELFMPYFDKLLDMLNGSYDSFSNCNAPLGEKLSSTIEKKMEVEVDIQTIYEDLLSKGSDKLPVLNKGMHKLYCSGFLSRPLPAPFAKLDASKTWMAYWLLNPSILLNTKLSEKIISDSSKNLIHFYNTSLCDSKLTAGFGGGEYQLPHLAASYAAVLALALTENEEAWKQIDTKKVKNWLLQMKQPNGSYLMHKGGETDTRAVYCALCIATLFNICDDEITSNVKEWLIDCQTFEGGFGGEPGDEAHGGYTYCALAALFILMKPAEILSSNLNFETLVKWTVDRQYSLEGGFSGRSNKLVDGCYSHWVGGTAALIEILINYKNGKDEGKYHSIIDRQRLQNYILSCCQDKLGLRDKPGMYSDFYHTNYVLCGLSMCQHYQIYDEDLATLGNAFATYPIKITQNNVIDSLPTNDIGAIDAVFGLPYTYAQNIYKFYAKK